VALIGEHCSRCRAAAEADNGRGGGLAGRWWRGWANAANGSGYIGAGIVGGFVVVVSVWYLARYVLREANKRRSRPVGLVGRV
jgi:high-affinity nickel-transport protein